MPVRDKHTVPDHVGYLYAKILRAAARGTQVLLTPGECTALLEDEGPTLIATGSTFGGEKPPWLTPTEWKRVQAHCLGLEVFGPGRGVPEADEEDEDDTTEDPE